MREQKVLPWLGACFQGMVGGMLRASQPAVAIKLIAGYARVDWAEWLFYCFKDTVSSGIGRRVLTTSLRSCRPNP